MDDFYRASRELIKSRLEFYLPFIEPLTKIYPKASILDLGCGRGEWLELLSERTDFNVYGIDSDNFMLTVCEQHGLPCQLGDMLSYLSNLESDSLAIISGFHIVEHIAFSDLQRLVKQALRVLKSSGLLILETPNSENIVVGTSEFYMDPTHKSPLPPNLLAFITEYYQFKQTKVVRLQAVENLLKSEKLSILDVLKGVSPDYAVIAQKEGSKVDILKFEPSFLRHYGLTLEEISIQYEHNKKMKVSEIETKIQALELKLHEATIEISDLKNGLSYRAIALLRKFKRILMGKF